MVRRKAKPKLDRPWDQLASRASTVVPGITEHVLPNGDVMVVEEGPDLLRLRVVDGFVSLRGGFLYVLRVTGPIHASGIAPYATAKSVKGYDEDDAFQLLLHIVTRWSRPPSPRLQRGWLHAIVSEWPKWKTFEGPYE